MTKKTYLIKVIQKNKEQYFLTINPEKKITCKMCNSIIFKNNADSKLDINVFDYFNADMQIIKKLDRRKKEYKQLYNKYKYFTVLDLVGGIN